MSPSEGRGVLWEGTSKLGTWEVRSLSCSDSDNGERAFAFTGKYRGTGNAVYVSAYFSETESVPSVEIDVFMEKSRELVGRLAVFLSSEKEFRSEWFGKLFENGSKDYWTAVDADLSKKERKMNAWFPFKKMMNEKIPPAHKDKLAKVGAAFIEDVLFSPMVARALSEKREDS